MLGALRQSSRAAVSMVSKRSMSSGVSLAEEIKEMKKWKVRQGRVWPFDIYRLIRRMRILNRKPYSFFICDPSIIQPIDTDVYAMSCHVGDYNPRCSSMRRYVANLLEEALH